MKYNFTILLVLITSFAFAQRGKWVNAGPDQIISSTQTANLKGTVHNVPNHKWSTKGSGYFDDKTALETKYHPGKADVANGLITLTLGSTDNPQIKDNLILTITSCPTVSVPASDTICGNDFGGSYDISAAVTGSHYYVQWTSDGQGYFYDETNPSTTYEYSSGDAGGGRVTFTITVYDSLGLCNPVSASFLLKLNDPARIDLGDLGYEACGTEPVLIDGGISGTATTVNWSTNGSGYFSPNPASSTNYYPSLQDRINGYIDIFGVTNDPPGPCGPGSDYTTINFTGPIVDAGADILICGYSGGGSIPLNAGLGNNTYNIQWTTNGAGYFDDEYSAQTNYNYDASDVNNAFIEIYATVSNGYCDDYTDTIKVNLQEAPYLYFPDQYPSACSSDPVIYAEVYLYGYASSGTWTTAGSGTFDDPNSTYTAYHGSKEDIDNGAVDLIFTTNDPVGPCGPTSGAVYANFYDCGKRDKSLAGRSIKTNKISLYPNPAGNTITLSSKQIIDRSKLYITDVTGKIYACKFTRNNVLNIADLANGVYFLHIISAKENNVLKFIKQR